MVKTALLRAVSHDLRSPLTAILAAAGPLGAERLDEAERRELAGVVATEAERLARLIEQLLDLSRLEAGGAEAHPEWSDLGEVAWAAAEELQLEEGAVRVQVARDTPLLRFDPVQLQRALVNLLGNATRYAQGHPVQVRAAPAPGRVLIRVVDQGPGIPQAQRERVFEPFYRAGTDHRTGFRGSGLGLAIARGFIEATAGGSGPSRCPSRARRSSSSCRCPSRSPSRRSRRPRPMAGRVLIVDDEPQILRALRVVLREAGFQALPAETAQQALDVAALQRPDAAIVDLGTARRRRGRGRWFYGVVWALWQSLARVGGVGIA